MSTRHLLLKLGLSLLIAFAVCFNPLAQQASLSRPNRPAAHTSLVPMPEDVLGFRPGDDRKLASWASVVDYFKKLAEASDRVKFEELGKSTMGAPFVVATISAPENLARLSEYQEIQAQLADPRKLGPNPNEKAAELISRGKTIVVITCGIHSTEVGSYLSSVLIAYRLASSDEPEVQTILRNSIILLVPSLNPDGVDIVKNWYDKTLGTPYEGTDPPELYHKYTGHDDNRDWYAFTQVETQLTVDKVLNVWHPQIVHDIHQQGAYGARLFLPPYMQPVEPNVPRQIVQGYTELGNALAKEMRSAGFEGITTNSTYDAWSPARAYSHYHGGVRILSETASCKLATPITVKFDDLHPLEGYNPQKESANFGPVWRGGEWHLRDITNYMTTTALFLMRNAAQNRQRWLQRFFEIGKEAVRPRKKGELFAFVVPQQAPLPLAYWDMESALPGILERGGLHIDYPGAFVVNGETFPQGTAVIRMAQPYGRFAAALLRAERYPDLRSPTGQPIAPYDVTAHTLSLLMGVSVTAVATPFRLPKPLPVGGSGRNGGCGGSPRRAIYRSHVPSMDEGWTRWVLDHGGICFFYLSLEDAETHTANLRAKYDTIIVPDQPPLTILNGYKPGTMPPEYTGGLGAEGVKALRDFVEQGGTLICLNRASNFAIQQFKLPLRDVTEGLSRTQFYVPGSILRIVLDTSNPIAAGMPKTSIAWAEDSPAFEVVGQANTAGGTPAVPGNATTVAASSVHIVARYPADRDPLLSGWLLGGNRIRGKAALVEVIIGKGRVILFGFRPQYRGQSLATYPLLFNAFKQPTK